MKFLKTFRFFAFLEGSSLILLLGIAVPLKYYFDMPQVVSYVGMAHGVLFLIYIFTAPVATMLKKLSILKLPIILIAAFIPFGTFVVVRYWFNESSLVQE